MDYKYQMDSTKYSFPDLYEKVIHDILSVDTMTPEIQETLQSKRNRGLQKYGEYSFQASFDNAMKSPTLEHASEELLDAINYIAHEIFKNKVIMNTTISKDLSLLLESFIKEYKMIINMVNNSK